MAGVVAVGVGVGVVGVVVVISINRSFSSSTGSDEGLQGYPGVHSRFKGISKAPLKARCVIIGVSEGPGFYCRVSQRCCG